MNREEILSHVDHTLLKPEATWPQIQTLCDEAIANHTASVCINTCYVKQAVEYMAGRIPVCCVVGFPLGAMDTASKAFEAKTAIENGAAEGNRAIRRPRTDAIGRPHCDRACFGGNDITAKFIIRWRG